MNKQPFGILKWSCRLLFLAAVFLVIKTITDFKDPYPQIHSITSDINNIQILDRNGKPLTYSYINNWNTSDTIPLYEIPELLQQAFIAAEDKRFFEHNGVDWLARSNALWQRISENDDSRGASTITEQTVRMLHPRKRSYWSKWIEGLEAFALEMRMNKAEILEFYLNQVPYASNRKGIVQASRFYFNRDIKTLNPKEMLALAVLVRAPSKFDLYKGDIPINESINKLALTLEKLNLINSETVSNIKKYDVVLDSKKLQVQAFHFVDFIRKNESNTQIFSDKKIKTTLDSNLQLFAEKILENRLKALASRKVQNAAVLIVDRHTNEIVAWVSVGAKCKETNYKADTCKIDMVTVPRQPASSLKPFLYASALEKGWTASTVIDDNPYSGAIGNGMHRFHNYSHSFYNKVSLRTALGNSLNIPALHTINFVGTKNYLDKLHSLGFTNLTKPAEFYDEGLALGNGEVTLFELVQAYTALANAGVYQPIKATFDNNQFEKKRVFYEEVASLISNILSDPWARHLEFGRGSVLNMPIQTAAKTGTSTDYRDAIAVGYNHKYVVGIWMGNADYTPTDGVTGALGPALALRSIFNHLNKLSETTPLYICPRLITKDICVNSEGVATNDTNCRHFTEYFINTTSTNDKADTTDEVKRIQIVKPSYGLEIAIDPRIPREKQAFEMIVSNVDDTDEVEWIINNNHKKIIGSKFLWPLETGKHTVQATVRRNNIVMKETPELYFIVK